MVMAITRKSVTNVLLLLCLVVASCWGEAKGVGRGRGRAARRVVRRDPNEKVFNVLQFGAKPDGRRDSALAFIRTFRAACEWKGKARMVVPRGTFLAGSMIFEGPCKAPIIVQFEGIIKALPDPSNYEEDFWMLFENIIGLTVTGTGTVDGQGGTVWKYNDGGGSRFPISIKFNHVTNGVIRQITSVNPMGMHIGIVLSQNIRAKRLHLYAPANSPNTDGIHISQSNIVKVAKSIIATGDDCVGIIQGSTDISVTKVTCGPGHGISIGSLGKYDDEKDVRGIYVTNCTLKGTDNGIRIKTWGGSPPSQASGMIFNGILMDRVKNPIIVDQFYGSKSKGPSRVKLSDIRYMNIRGTTVSNVAVNLQCSQSFPCDRVQMSNINLRYVGAGRLPIISTCANARVSYAGMQFPPPCRR